MKSLTESATTAAVTLKAMAVLGILGLLGVSVWHTMAPAQANWFVGRVGGLLLALLAVLLLWLETWSYAGLWVGVPLVIAGLALSRAHVFWATVIVLLGLGLAFAGSYNVEVGSWACVQVAAAGYHNGWCG